MEGVKTLDHSPEGLPGVEGVERSDGGGGNWGGPPPPCRLRCWCVWGTRRLDWEGRGAHGEVGSEGFEANCRAVAEVVGEPVGQIQVIPSLHYGGEGSTWGAWTQQGVCGRHGGKATRVTPGDLVRLLADRGGGLGGLAARRRRRGSRGGSRRVPPFARTRAEEKTRGRAP